MEAGHDKQFEEAVPLQVRQDVSQMMHIWLLESGEEPWGQLEMQEPLYNNRLDVQFVQLEDDGP